MRRNTLLSLCLLAFSPPLWGISDADIVQGLETLGDLEAAYPLAMQVAEKQNSYQAWREIASKYVKYDSGNQAYLKTWQAARAVNLEPVYRDFMQVRPQSTLNAQAIHALFELSRELDTIQGYMRFMRDFPNTPEAVQALLRIHEIAFERAKEKHDPEIYDAFVTTFTGAKQIPQVIELAFQSEKTSVEKEIGGSWFDLSAKYYADENRERTARRLFNEARIAEKAANSLVSGRKYRLIELAVFKDTKAYTELLDRAERLDYQKLQAEREKQLAQQMDILREAVVKTVQSEHLALRRTLQEQGQETRQEIRLQGQRLEDAILQHNTLIEQQLEAVNQRVSATNQQMNRQINQVYNDMDHALNQVQHQFNAQVGAISNAMQSQTATIQGAANQSSWQQEALFDQAQEQQREESQKNRHCAEQLAKYGEYRWLSGCP